jgi:hypothetical protein
MTVDGRILLLALGPAAAASALFALLVQVDGEEPIQIAAPPSLRGTTAAIETAALPPADRFAFVGPDVRLDDGSAAAQPERTMLVPDPAPAATAALEAEPPPRPIDGWRLSISPTLRLPWRQAEPPPETPPSRRYSLAEKLGEIGPGATERLAKKFSAAGAPWPPAEVMLVAVKEDRSLELFARPPEGLWKFIHRFPVLAASGTTGPKLRQGDKQVPEGIYRISYLNPNSRYHVSLRVDYPNAFDRQMAALDGRRDLGGDIMIHGKAASVGCLAVGDEAAEELFVLAAETGTANVKLIIAPRDFRRHGVTAAPGQPPWVQKLYGDIAHAMADFRAPPPPSLWSFLGN